MLSRPRVPRIQRSTLVLILAVAALAFPLGVLANHNFADVPTAASYHDDVEALVEAGVTSGCGGGNYCPNQAVTRGSMAQFLNRLGNLDGNSTPSVHAATADDIQGWAPNELTRAAYNSSNALLDGDAATSASLTVNITAPWHGWLLINSHAAIYNESTSSNDDARCVLEVDNNLVAGSAVWIDTHYVSGGPLIDEQGCSPSAGYAVCSGAHSVELAVSSVGADLNINNAALTVQYVPFDGSGNPKSIFDCLIISPFEEQDRPAKD